jgi:hypothetical protein
VRGSINVIALALCHQSCFTIIPYIYIEDAKYPIEVRAIPVVQRIRI